MTISLVFDIIIALICGIIIIKDAARGFIKSFMTFARTILAFLLAYIFNAPLARLLSGKLFYNFSRRWIYDAFCSTNIGEDQYALYQLFDGIPNWFTNLTVSSGVESSMVDEYFVNETPATMEVLNQMSDSLGSALSSLISTIVSFIIIFILAEIVFGILGALLNKIGKLPMLKFINILLGASIGVVVSAVVAWLICKGVSWIINFGSNYYPNIFKQEIIQNSSFLRYFAEHDLWAWAKGILSR